MTSADTIYVTARARDPLLISHPRYKGINFKKTPFDCFIDGAIHFLGWQRSPLTICLPCKTNLIFNNQPSYCLFDRADSRSDRGKGTVLPQWFEPRTRGIAVSVIEPLRLSEETKGL